MLATCALPAAAHAGTPYDQGSNPAIAAYGHNLVEVHQGGAGPGPLWYRTGAAGSSVAWSGSQQCDGYGMQPSVATGDARVPSVVEVHQGGSGAGPLWYRTAVWSGGHLMWKDSHQYDYYGVAPSVAMNLAGTVVEVHQGGSGAGPLWYRVGFMAADGSSVFWGDSHPYDNYGMRPSVAVDPSGLAVKEVHQGGSGIGPLWTRVAKHRIRQHPQLERQLAIRLRRRPTRGGVPRVFQRQRIHRGAPERHWILHALLRHELRALLARDQQRPRLRRGRRVRDCNHAASCGSAPGRPHA